MVSLIGSKTRSAYLRLRHARAVLIDLSGTLHIGDNLTEGAAEALERLRRTGLRLRFVTNTTKEPRQRLLQRLRRAGLAVCEDELHSALSAVQGVLQERRILRPLLLLSKEAAAEVWPGGGEELEGVQPVGARDAVVVGLAPERLNYQDMNRAFRLLMAHPDAPLIAIHKARYYQRGDGLALGPGPFVEALEAASGRAAILVGKPSLSFFRSAACAVGVEEEQCVMVGDDWRDDVEGAMDAGMMGLLVQTGWCALYVCKQALHYVADNGKYRHGDEDKMMQPPLAVCSCFAAAVDMIVMATTQPTETQGNDE